MRIFHPTSLVVLLLVILFPHSLLFANEHELAPEKNAFNYYRRAGDSLQNLQLMLKFYDSNVTKPDLNEKRALVLENTQALTILREGFAYPSRFPVIKSFDEPMPYLVKFRNLARLMKLEAEVKATDGDWPGANDICLDIVYLGKDIQQGAPIIGCMVSIACQVIGRKPAWEYLHRLNPAQSRQAIKRLQAIDADSAPFIDVLAIERDAVLTTFRELRDNPESFRQVIEENSGDKLDVPVEIMETVGRQITEGALAEYSAHMDKLIAMAQTPFHAWQPLPAPKNKLVEIFLIDFRKAGFRVLSNQTQNRLMLVSHALNAFKAEKGQYPKSLASLCPEYLHELPLDPFGKNQPFRYRVTKTGYLLYSIGPDARDNGGKAVMGKDKSHLVYDQSKGDIVAGVNGY